jgi:hypothetical protein
MGGARGTYGGETKYLRGFGAKNLKARNLLEYLSVDGRAILK